MTPEEKYDKDRRVVTETCRLAFASLFEKRATSKDKDAREAFQAAIIIPEDVSLKPFKKAIKAAQMKKWGVTFKLVGGNRNPIHDCEEKPELEGYEEGMHFLNTKTGYQPSVLDQSCNPIINKTKIKSGDWCRFDIEAYGWESDKGGKGVSFSLVAVQLVEEGDPFGGGGGPRDNQFESIEVDDDDEYEDDDDDDDEIDSLYE